MLNVVAWALVGLGFFGCFASVIVDLGWLRPNFRAAEEGSSRFETFKKWRQYSSHSVYAALATAFAGGALLYGLSFFEPKTGMEHAINAVFGLAWLSFAIGVGFFKKYRPEYQAIKRKYKALAQDPSHFYYDVVQAFLHPFRFFLLIGIGMAIGHYWG